nr:THO complex subunit 2 [Biomphalaria glabrata]
MRWHSSPAIYEKECFNFPGFLTVFRKGTDMNNKMNRLDYVNYRHVCHKWHFRLTKSVITCLESKNYSQMRNSLIVLTKILPNFPRMTQIGMAIERRVDKLSKEEKDKRPDIYALVILYAGQLMSKKPTWVQETKFHIKEPKKTNNTAAQNQTQQQWQSDSSSGISTKRDVDGRSKDVKPELSSREEKRATESEREKRAAEKKENLHWEATKLAKEKAKEEKRERKEREAFAKEEERHSSRVKDYEGSSASHNLSASSHRHSAEPSPKHLEERDPKRRRLEMSGSSQVSIQV